MNELDGAIWIDLNEVEADGSLITLNNGKYEVGDILLGWSHDGYLMLCMVIDVISDDLIKLSVVSETARTVHVFKGIQIWNTFPK